MRDLHEGWKAFVEHTWVWLLAVWIAVFFLISYAPFFVLGPYLAKQEMGGAGAWATVLTGEAIGALLGGLVAMRLRPPRPMLVCVLVFTLDSLQLMLLAEGAPFGAIAVAASIAGFAFAFGSVIYETALQRTIAPEKLSRVALVQLARGDVGAAARLRDRRPGRRARSALDLLWIGAIWVVVSAIAVALVPSVRNLRTDAAPEAAPAAGLAAGRLRAERPVRQRARSPTGRRPACRDGAAWWPTNDRPRRAPRRRSPRTRRRRLLRSLGRPRRTRRDRGRSRHEDGASWSGCSTRSETTRKP